MEGKSGEPHKCMVLTKIIQKWKYPGPEAIRIFNADRHRVKQAATLARAGIASPTTACCS